MSILLVYLGYHFDLPLWYMIVAWSYLILWGLKVLVAFVDGVRGGKRKSD